MVDEVLNIGCMRLSLDNSLVVRQRVGAVGLPMSVELFSLRNGSIA